EDGIRGRLVTGVQTCALPISPSRHVVQAHVTRATGPIAMSCSGLSSRREPLAGDLDTAIADGIVRTGNNAYAIRRSLIDRILAEIGRASWRERVCARVGERVI